jgi:hypothetical protein
MGVAPAAASGPVPMMMMPPPGMPMIGVQTGSTLTSAGNATRAVGHDAPRRSSNVALVMATAALVVAGWLVFKQRDHGAAVAAVPPKPAPAAVATAAADPGSPGSAAITAASGPPAALAPAPAVSASAAAATSATPAPRTVKLLVAPADAIVEVDGVPAKVTGGAVDVTGALGSTHTVHLSKGKRDHQEDVAITARGALPDRVSIASPSGGARGGRPVFVIKAPTFGGGGDGRAGSGSGGGGRGPGGSDDGTGGEPAIDLMPPANGDWTRPLDSPSQ